MSRKAFLIRDFDRICKCIGLTFLLFSIPAFLLIAAQTANAITINEFPVTTASSTPLKVITGPDGNLWFTEQSGNKIGKITTEGVITEYSSGLTANSQPGGITSGSDGNLWFTEQSGNKIGMITTDGVITEYSSGLTANSTPKRITHGPDGNLWFTEQSGNKIGKITTDGVITEYSSGLTANSQPHTITSGPDGNLWFTEQSGNKIGMITTDGVITEYSSGLTASSQPNSITHGTDGNLWFTEQSGNKIGMITTDGVITEYTIPTAGSQPSGITSGPDDNLWFAEQNGNNIGEVILPLTAVPTLSVSPMSVNLGSVKLGGSSSPKTVTIKNTSRDDLVIIISSITITGANQSEFTQTNNCTLIPAKGSCTITVTFSPIVQFGNKSAIMSISSNDTKKPVINVKLLGQAPPPKISVTPKSVNLGSVSVGITSAPKTVTVKNTGISDLTVNAIAFEGANASEFSETNNCTTVSDKNSCTISVTLTPTSAGTKTATMNISSNDPNKPVIIVKLSGKSKG